MTTIAPLDNEFNYMDLFDNHVQTPSATVVEGYAALILRHWYPLRSSKPNVNPCTRRYRLECLACKEEFYLHWNIFPQHFKSDSCAARRWRQITLLEERACPAEIIAYLKNLTAETPDDVIMDLLLKLDVLKIITFEYSTAPKFMLKWLLSVNWGESLAAAQGEDHTQMDGDNVGMGPPMLNWDVSSGQPDYHTQVDAHYTGMTPFLDWDTSLDQPDYHTQVDAHYTGMEPITSWDIPSGQPTDPAFNSGMGPMTMWDVSSGQPDDHTHCDACNLNNGMTPMTTWSDTSSGQPDDHTDCDACNNGMTPTTTWSDTSSDEDDDSSSDHTHNTDASEHQPGSSPATPDWYQIYLPPHGALERCRISCLACKVDFSVYGVELVEHFTSAACAAHRLQHLEGLGYPPVAVEDAVTDLLRRVNIIRKITSMGRDTVPRALLESHLSCLILPGSNTYTINSTPADIMCDWYRLYVPQHGALSRGRVSCMACKEDFSVYGDAFMEHFTSASCSAYRWQQITHLKDLGYPEQVISFLKESTLTPVVKGHVIYALLRMNIMRYQPTNQSTVPCGLESLMSVPIYLTKILDIFGDLIREMEVNNLVVY